MTKGRNAAKRKVERSVIFRGGGHGDHILQYITISFNVAPPVISWFISPSNYSYITGTITGWWFGTFFSIIYGIVLPID